jgi:hypothetical protein
MYRYNCKYWSARRIYSVVNIKQCLLLVPLMTDTYCKTDKLLEKKLTTANDISFHKRSYWEPTCEYCSFEYSQHTGGITREQGHTHKHSTPKHSSEKELQNTAARKSSRFNNKESKANYQPALALRSSGVTMTTKRMARSFLNISYDQRRTDRMHFTAAIPLLAIST